MDTLTFRVCPQGIEETRLVLDAFLEALTVANELYYRRYPAGPCCPKCGGIKYRPPTAAEENEPGEAFASVEAMVVDGFAACGSIAAMVAAHYRHEGVHAVARSVPQSQTKRKYHAVVELPDGTRKDPSAALERFKGQGCGCAVAA